MLRLVQKIRALGPHVAIMVMPAAKQQAHTMMWVARWNRLEHAPFLLHRTCSCHLGKAIDGLQTSIFLARSYGSNGEFPTCGLVPATTSPARALFVHLQVQLHRSCLPAGSSHLWRLLLVWLRGHSLTLQLLTPGVARLRPHFQLSECETLPLMGNLNHSLQTSPAEVIPLKPD